MREGTDYFLSQLECAQDLSEPSSLPGWSRAIVVAHFARNADALGRLLHWADTGIESPMYAGPTQRDDEIRATVAKTANDLLADARRSAQLFDEALSALPDDAWTHEVRTARGRTVPASEVPWMRLREVWVHAVDLRSGATMADLPPDVIDALLDDVVATFTARGDTFDVTLDPTDRERSWPMGGADPPFVTGTAAAVLAWLIGRPPPSPVDDGAGLTPPTWP